MAATSLNTQQFQEQLQAGKPLLVDFWAPWCGYCRRIGPAYDRVAGEQAGQLTVAKVNIDEEPGLANAYGIEVIPTLVLFRDGKVVASVTAPDSKAAIDSFLREHL